jgi:flagellar biogenesis protein FliO
MILKIKPQRMGAPAEVVASQGFSTTNGGRQCGSAQPARVIISEGKYDGTFPEIPEVPTKLVQHSESESTASRRRSLSQITWRVLKQVVGWLAFGWNRARQQVRFEQRRKRLRVCESLSLGEKRFVALIEVDGEQILVGGGASGVATLARLQPSREFAGMMKERWIREPHEA